MTGNGKQYNALQRAGEKDYESPTKCCEIQFHNSCPDHLEYNSQEVREKINWLQLNLFNSDESQIT